MTNKILAFIFAVAMGAAVPVVAVADTSIEIIDTDIQTINVAVTESAIHVTGANGQVLHVYNVTGMKLMSVKIEGQDKKVEINLPKGCYIVKVGKVVRKIYIK
ncbi:MAG: T9SS C-terminal target domain-containing protein [Prevotella sp.]|nr:T9SS C-terminal target domain-containing protein [Prevotella sp.]MBP5506698.1 T9SS C-terminal target domain-containing protein [Prevotella sp.]